MNYNASEVKCAQRMMSIARGSYPLRDGDHTVDEVAERYDVTRDAVYRGIRQGSPLYPKAEREGCGPKAWLYITREALEACDANRLEFYKRTPSWLKLAGLDWQKPPPRIAARVLLGDAI